MELPEEEAAAATGGLLSCDGDDGNTGFDKAEVERHFIGSGDGLE